MKTELTKLTEWGFGGWNSKNSVNSVSNSAPRRFRGEINQGSWLPDMDLNHDKQIQSLLCYRYTIGQAGACKSVNLSCGQSSHQTEVPEGRKTIAHDFNRGIASRKDHKPRRAGRNATNIFCRPFGTRFIDDGYPRLKPWA